MDTPLIFDLYIAFLVLCAHKYKTTKEKRRRKREAFFGYPAVGKSVLTITAANPETNPADISVFGFVVSRYWYEIIDSIRFSLIPPFSVYFLDRYFDMAKDSLISLSGKICFTKRKLADIQD